MGAVMDTSIPLSNLLRPHIQSPAESFGFEQQVKQARFEDQQRQQKMQQDQQMKQIFSNPQYLDKETGGLNTNGIIAGGRVLGPEWAGKVSHQYAQTLGSMSEQKKRLHEIDISNKKQSATWAKTLYEESLADLAAESKSKPMSEAFSTVRQKMVDRINELFSSGEAAQMGLNEEHHQKYLQALPKDYEHLKASQTKVADLEKQLEAMMSGQPAPAAPEGPQIGAPKQQGPVDQTALPDTPLQTDKKNQISDVKEMRQDANKIRALSEIAASEHAKDVSNISEKLTGVGLDKVGTPEASATGPKSQTPTQKRAEADKLRQSAVAQDALGNVNNAKKQRDQAKLLVAEADRQEHESRVAANKVKIEMNQAPISDETASRIAKSFVAGDHQAAQGFARNQAAQAKIADAVTREMRAQNNTPEEINAGKARFQSYMSAHRTLGTREANLAIAVEELKKFIPLAQKASDAVPRTDFVPLNILMKKGREQWSPEQAAFAAQNRAVINAFAQVSSRGAPTVHSTEEAEILLNTAKTPEMYKATLKALMQEAEAASKAPITVRDEMGEEMAHKKAKPPADIPGNTPSAVIPGDTAAGSPVQIKSDDDYNKLKSGARFIGPDGKLRRKP
jgi:hypothetical protein